MIIVGIGNILQKDDGFGIYAATYLHKNYTFSKDIEIINGGIEGINLLNIFMENDHILILDTIDLKDSSSSIYLLPAEELSGHGLNSGGAHEIGVLQCLDMLEMQGKTIPKSTIVGIVPQEVTFDISLSTTLKDAFDGYIKVVSNYLIKNGITAKKRDQITTLEDVINLAKNPSSVMI